MPPQGVSTGECILKSILSVYVYLTSAQLTHLPYGPVAVNTQSPQTVCDEDFQKTKPCTIW